MTNDYSEDEVTERSYRQSVKRLAVMLALEIADRGDDISECMDECLQVAADSRWTMMNFQAASLLIWSKNRNAIFDANEEWATGAQSIQEMNHEAAKFAMAQDIMTEVEKSFEEVKG